MKKYREILKDKDPEKEFLRVFEKLSRLHSAWSVWQDFISMTAVGLSNAVDKRPDIHRKREDEYLNIIKKYTKEEEKAFIELFALTTLALELNPAQDFLGELYMKLNLSNHWKGQFFTPWHVAEMMARMVTSQEDLPGQIKKQGYISVCDTACGAGCILLVFADVCKSVCNVNYQQSVLFVGQDIDPIAAKMCYIQMSLLGCPGYVYIGNTITEPISGSDFNPVVDRPEDLWFTPMWYRDIWRLRQMFYAALELESAKPIKTETPPAAPKPVTDLKARILDAIPENPTESKPESPGLPAPETTQNRHGSFNLRDFFKRKE